MLDGGLIKWAEDGYEITVEEPSVEVNRTPKAEKEMIEFV